MAPRSFIFAIIATANYLDRIPGPLLDRMERVDFAGYTEAEKVEIAKRYLLPRQRKENGLTDEELQMEDEAVLTIIQHYTREAGVRQLEREVGKFARKVSNTTGRVRKELSDLFDHYMALEKNLRDLAAAGGIGSAGIPSVSGVFTALTKDAALTDAQDPDLVQPAFEVGEMDNPRAPRGPQGGRNELDPFGNP